MIETIHIKMANRLKKEALDEGYEKTILRKYNLKSKKYLIFISFLWPHKNHDRLLKAFSIFLNDQHNTKIKGIKLAIIGNKTMKKTLSIAKELKIESEIVAPGYVSKKELDIILKHALAFIHPSLYEGFGMPIIEAMAAGVPVVSSTAGSLSEIGGNAVLFFDPYKVDEIAEAIRKITIDQKLRESLIKRGYERAKYFEDNDAMIDSYIHVFEKIMASRNAAH
jgi:glycosyltransferase involved in cell wall biosynthesis